MSMEKDEDKYLLFNDNEDNVNTENKNKQNDKQNTGVKGPSEILISFSELFSDNKFLKALYFIIFLHPIFNYIINKKIINSMFTNEEYLRVNKCGFYLLIFFLFFIQFITPNKSTTTILTIIIILFIVMHFSRQFRTKDIQMNIKKFIKKMCKR